MTTHLNTQDELEAALRALVAQDIRLTPVLEATGIPALRRRPPGFAGLASTICGQQLSTFAAAAIWARIDAAFGDPAHHHFRSARADRLRRFGLSAAKIKTLKFVANEIHHGRLDLVALAETPADDAHTTLTALHGIGPWTADIYLLFCLGNADAWPAGDLALQEAIKIALKLSSRPTVKEMAVIADAWRPYRGAAAHLFWAYYRVAKTAGFDAAPPDSKAATGNKKKPKRAKPAPNAAGPSTKSGKIARSIRKRKTPEKAKSKTSVKIERKNNARKNNAG